MPRGPRYRYFSNPPSTVGLRLGDLGDIPQSAFTPFYDADRHVEIPTADILGGPMPKISFARLAELVPDAFQVGIHSGVQLRVPASRLALAYQLVESRELIAEPLEDLPVPPPVEETFALLETLPSPSGEKFAPILDDLPPAPVGKEATPEDKSAKQKLPPIAPPLAVPAAKEDPVLPPASKPPLPEVLPPAASAPVPEPPKVVEPVPVVAKVEPLPKPSPAAPLAEPLKADVVPPVAPEAAAPAKPVVETLPPVPKVPPAEAVGTPPVGSSGRDVMQPPPEAAREPAGPLPKDAPSLTPIAPRSPDQVAPPAPIARKPFSLLPIFRRKVVEPPKPIVTPEPRARVEIPKPKKPLAPITNLAPTPEPPSPATPPPAQPPAKPVKPEIPALGILKDEPLESKNVGDAPAPAAISAPPPAVLKVEAPVSKPAPVEPVALAPAPGKSEAVFVETEHFPQGGKELPEEIPEQDSLQALFLTEDVLSVERVVELCNGLPGIKSCILTRSGSVINARNVPDSIDLISLSANALEMFSAMRGSCAKMGIGAVPAVTMHSQKGPITFFHEEDICLLVLHKDRGFVPGVREKLQTVVEELAKANLLLPVAERSTKKLK
ncbi:hypothetical protein BH09VER1_BH09VER1_04000 [soil metagenome]